MSAQQTTFLRSRSILQSRPELFNSNHLTCHSDFQTIKSSEQTIQNDRDLIQTIQQTFYGHGPNFMVLFNRLFRSFRSKEVLFSRLFTVSFNRPFRSLLITVSLNRSSRSFRSKPNQVFRTDNSKRSRFIQIIFDQVFRKDINSRNPNFGLISNRPFKIWAFFYMSSIRIILNKSYSADFSRNHSDHSWSKEVLSSRLFTIQIWSHPTDHSKSIFTCSVFRSF